MVSFIVSPLHFPLYIVPKMPLVSCCQAPFRRSTVHTQSWREASEGETLEEEENSRPRLRSRTALSSGRDCDICSASYRRKEGREGALRPRSSPRRSRPTGQQLVPYLSNWKTIRGRPASHRHVKEDIIGCQDT